MGFYQPQMLPRMKMKRIGWFWSLKHVRSLATLRQTVLLMRIQIYFTTCARLLTGGSTGGRTNVAVLSLSEITEGDEDEEDKAPASLVHSSIFQ